MTNTYSLGDLIHDSFRVTHGMIAVFQDTKHEVTLSVDFFVQKFDGCYAVSNSTVIGFIHQSKYYVAPYTTRAIATLVENSFKEANFYVPFSASDCPKREAKRWKYLQEKAKKTPEENFSAECEKFCNEPHIGALSPVVMRKSLMIPMEGLRVKYTCYESITYPVLVNFRMDGFTKENLGTYYMSNGVIVFVYRDGHTYVTRGYKVVQYLRDAGYHEKCMRVPLSSGEKIMHEEYRKKWESIRKWR